MADDDATPRLPAGSLHAQWDELPQAWGGFTRALLAPARRLCERILDRLTR